MGGMKLIAVAEVRAEVCVACAQYAPIASNRRQFEIASSSHVLPMLSGIIRQIDPAASLSLACQGCFSSLEKLNKSDISCLQNQPGTFPVQYTTQLRPS